MSAVNPAVVANDVEHLTTRVEKLEAKVEAITNLQRWQMGAATVLGAVLTLLLPKISAILGLS